MPRPSIAVGLSLYNKLYLAIGCHEVTCLFILCVSSAFDAVDNAILFIFAPLSSIGRFGTSETTSGHQHSKHSHLSLVLKVKKTLLIPITKLYNLRSYYINQLCNTRTPAFTRSSSHLAPYRPSVSYSMQLCSRSLVFAAPTFHEELLIYFRPLANPHISPTLSLHSSLLPILHSRLETKLFRLT